MTRAALIVALALGGCARTEMVVSIASTELSAPTDFDRLTIKVTNPGLDPSGSSPLYAPPPLAVCATRAAGCYTLPLTVTLYPGSARPDEKVRIEVQALHGSDPQPAMAQAALFTFTRGASEQLRFDLYRNCLGVRCAQFDQGCGMTGTCTNVAPVGATATPDAGGSGGVVTVISTTSAAPSYVTSFDVPAPQSLQPGDLLLLAMDAAQNATDAPASSPGWTLQTDFPPSPRSSIFSHLAGPSEPATYSFSFPASSQGAGVTWSLVQLRGARVIDAIAALTEYPPLSAPSVTTTQPGDLVLTFVDNGHGVGVCDPPAGAKVISSTVYLTIAATTAAAAAGPTGDRPFACNAINTSALTTVATYAIAPR